MTRVEIIKIFLASPGDVEAERRIVREVLDSVNRTLGQEKGVRFEVVSWDTDSIPSYGQDAQAILNEQIGDMTAIDLFVGIMWNRFGSATPRAESGTEEEFRRAVESRKETGRPAIMFYFNRTPFDASSSQEAEQKLKVLRFKEDMRANGLTQDYGKLEEFGRLFRFHIEKWLLQQRPPTLSLSEPTSITQPERADVKGDARPEVLNSSGMWFLLGSKFSLASDVTELDVRKIMLKIPISEADEDAFFRSLQPSQFGRKEIVPFAHQNMAGLARVIDAKRRSFEGNAGWDLTLELEELDSGFGSEMAYGSTSADEIAVMRARLLLLNEKPPNRFQNNQLENTFFQTFVYGIGSRVKASSSALPLLWKDAKGDTSKFLPVARLWSIFHLVTTNTCEYVLELTLGPIKEGIMHVRFRGQRKNVYSNAEPVIIEFEGDCDLNTQE